MKIDFMADIHKENEQIALTELEELLLSRIKQANESPVSSVSIQQITDSALRSTPQKTSNQIQK